MEKNIGLFICSGCEIDKNIDIDSLVEEVKKDPTVKTCQSNPTLCNPEGIKLIKETLSTGKLDGLVIGACSSRFKTNGFNFEGVNTERVNLREQVSWCSGENDEDVQMMAVDYMNMGITKIKTTKLPTPFILENIYSDILVIGGGTAGIHAALEGAKAGYKITLLEKEQNLGGYAAKLYKQIPFSAPFTNPVTPEIKSDIEEITKHPEISVHTSSEIISVSGQPGNFCVKFKEKNTEREIHISSIVMATGWKPYDAGKLTEYKINEIDNVITSIEFEELVKSNRLIRSNGILRNVLFIQCAGSRDEKHLPYCSNVCCGTSLKQAAYLIEMAPEANIFVVYKDIRTPGKYEHFYKEIQKNDRVFLTKGNVSNLTQDNGHIRVDVKDTLLQEDFQLEVDLVVLAVGMTPSNTEDLNLEYRLGKGLPELKYGFPDSHFICFPYETRRTGIYTAGALRSPQDIQASKEDAEGAMLKAIQCLEMVKQGKALHPRSGDVSYPDLYLDRCTECKRCTEECPFGTYDETPSGTPLLNPNRCRSCGICLGACPERIISFEDYSINSVSSIIKSIHVPDEFEEKPRILIFACENDAYPAIDMAGYHRLKYSAFVRIIPVRCLGSVNKVWISDALAKGFDGILQIGCKPGDDYQCHFIHGSELNETRGENIQETLETMMLEPERIKTEFVEIDEYYKIPDIINDYVEEIELIGPNPFKEM